MRIFNLSSYEEKIIRVKLSYFNNKDIEVYGSEKWDINYNSDKFKLVYLNNKSSLPKKIFYLFYFDYILVDNNIDFLNKFKNKVINIQNEENIEKLIKLYNENDSKIELNKPIYFIIPTVGRLSLYNAIESILNQTNNNWKLLVIFDNNFTKMKQFSKEYNDTRITFINEDKIIKKNNKNGHGRAGLIRNTGLDYISYEDYSYVGFLDDDDRLSPNYIDNLEKELYINQSIDLQVIIFRLNVGIKIYPRPFDNTFEECYVGISFCLKKEIANEFRFDYGYMEDYKLLNKLRQNNKNIIISKFLNYFCKNVDNYKYFKFHTIKC
jgi:hypothetical protein